jgi:hypothetical protein
MRRSPRCLYLFGLLLLVAFSSFSTPINTLGRATSKVRVHVTGTTAPFNLAESDPTMGNIEKEGTFHGPPQPPTIFTELFSQYKVETKGSIVPSVWAQADLMITYGDMIGGGKAEAESEIKYSIMLATLDLAPIPMPKTGVAHITARLGAYANSAFVVGGPGSVRAEASLKIPGVFIDRFGDPYVANASGVNTDNKAGEDALHMNYYTFDIAPGLHYEVIIKATATVTGNGGTGIAYAYVDPLFELDPASKPYFELLYSPNLIGATPEVPEPATWPLIASSIAALLVYGRRRCT